MASAAARTAAHPKAMVHTFMADVSHLGPMSQVANGLLIAAFALAPYYLVAHTNAFCRGHRDALGYDAPGAPSHPVQPFHHAPVTERLGHQWCKISDGSALHAINVFFWPLWDLGPWIVFQLIGSSWPVDAFWTIAPVLVNQYDMGRARAFATAKGAADAGKVGMGMGMGMGMSAAAHTPTPWRSTLVTGLVWLWAARLSHSYLRREGYRLGAREDWRYARMRAGMPKWLWTIASFPLVHLAQHVLIFGLTCPLWFLHAAPPPASAAGLLMELACAAGALASLGAAYAADTSLFRFASAATSASRARARGVLETGLWAYSRRANYVAETAWWTFLALWVWVLPDTPSGHAIAPPRPVMHLLTAPLATIADWYRVVLGTALPAAGSWERLVTAFWGVAFNTVGLWIVTLMVEARMADKRVGAVLEKQAAGDVEGARVAQQHLAAWETYRRRTPAWLPPFGKGSLIGEKLFRHVTAERPASKKAQ
ncbi:hypothetical protein CXG81DRAFT_21157 [Caulochytrium protostelioides]|uniref:Uncharacterized protein n=1 Tax=Caulochytrium protostelioides TaxID=1555241 RepID=A0A4P9X1A1_9FUNG|nr:hypothetical protein CXG81DRAFT_21157 [Caulochytrium protostelioides]|eukprot:RKO98643.1 hypothetical protein CXG81DRAFT_21157 [Caulochytrium protostelioides]